MKKSNEHKCINKTELLTQTNTNIEKAGLQVIMVQPTGYSPSFAYSIGLYKTYKHPEIICFGLPDDLGHTIIAEFLEVDKKNMSDYFGTAINYYDTENFPAFQLVWTDRNDKFPWEDNFEEKFLFEQPLLDRNSNFKFREAKRLAVFTTRQWLELEKPILRVVHDNDGDWQFLTGDQLPEDIKLVALEELIAKDNTLNDVFDLDYGQSAEREVIGGGWTKTKVKNEDEE